MNQTLNGMRRILITILVAMGVGALFIVAIGENPIDAYAALFRGAFDGELRLGTCLLYTSNYPARMLASAVLAAQSQNLEYVQFVSFGCGHDAYLSDEIQRMMREISGKSPLILKLDESEVQGPLRIRVRSFLETINMRRKKREMEMCIRDRCESGVYGACVGGAGCRG